MKKSLVFDEVNMQATQADIKKLRRASELLSVYSFDRYDYSKRESKEAKKLSIYLTKLANRILENR